MKKFMAFLLSAVLLCSCGVALFGCSDEEAESVDVYVPDGAPALALAQLMNEESQFDSSLSGKAYSGVTYNVVSASTIQTYIAQGDESTADICVLPSNAAASVLGSGESYQMLGTVTHGNVYWLSQYYYDTELTADNLSTQLSGKKIGCLQLSNIVGWMLKIVLSNANITYSVGSDPETDEVPEGEVYLYAISDASSQITVGTSYDYMIAAEPAVSAKVKATSSNDTGKQLIRVGDMQELYGGEDGWTQAVIVAKNDLIEEESEFITEFIDSLDSACEWVNDEEVDIETVVNAISGHLTGEDASSTFTTGNLSADVISRCAVDFENASDCKEDMLELLEEIMKIDSSASFTVKDGFFYTAS